MRLRFRKKALCIIAPLFCLNGVALGHEVQAS